MLIQLPVETWIEILDWLRRRDLIKKLDKLWDRQFTPIVQDWLHKYTKNVKVGSLRADNHGLSFINEMSLEEEQIPFAGVELPGNITSFKQIEINYLDSNMLTMLQQMRPLFHKLCLIIDYEEDEPLIQTALRLLMPMFSSIELIVLDSILLQFFSVNHPSVLLNAKFLNIWDDANLDAISERLINWLFTPRDDCLPRTLVLHFCENTDGFCRKIQERFLDSTRQCASPFLVRFWISFYQDDIYSMLNVENVQTGEQLTFNTMEHGYECCYGLITNCPKNTKLEWLDEKTEELLEWDMNKQQRAIMLTSLKISPQLYAAEDAGQQQSKWQRKEAHLRRL